MTVIVNPCSICTEDLNIRSKWWCTQNNETIKKLECTHQYHELCINEWLKNHDTCPLCRSIVKNVTQVNKISDNTVININEIDNNREQNKFINKIKNNKKYIVFFILYILLLASAITQIITSLSMINYINEYNNTNNSDNLDVKNKINNINTEIILISVYLGINSLLILIGFLEKHYSKYGLDLQIHLFCSTLVISLTILYILYIVINNNNTIDYIKSFNFTDENEKKLNHFYVKRYFIILIYNAVVATIYSLSFKVMAVTLYT